MGVRRVHLHVPFQVIIGHVLLQLTVQLLVAVVDVQVREVFLFNKVSDILLLGWCQGFILSACLLHTLGVQKVRSIVANSCLASNFHPSGKSIVVGCIWHLIVLVEG